MDMKPDSPLQRALKFLRCAGSRQLERARDFGGAVVERYDAFANPDLRKIDILSRQLWGGYPSYALADLRNLHDSKKLAASARAQAAWEIARWYAHRQENEKLFSLLASLERAGLPQDWQISFLILEVDALCRLGRIDQAKSILAKAMEFHGPRTDLHLLLANAGIEKNLAGASLLDEERLAHINRVFESSGLLTFRKTDAGRPLAIDNISGTITATSRVSGQQKISVIVPAYNAASTIAYALAGVASQTWGNLEILVVDDGSADDTAAIVQRLVSADSRIRLLRSARNEGPYVARNKALAEASGDFIAVNDADDWPHPQKLQLQAELLQKGDAAACLTHLVRTDFNLRFHGGSRPRERLSHLNYSSLMLPVNHARELGGWDPVRFGADYEFLNRTGCAYGAKKLARLMPDVPLSFALDREHSLTNQPATHLLTHFSGARQEYTEAWKRWHKTAGKSRDFRIDPDPKGRRRFPAPWIMLSRESSPRYDVIFVSDFSSTNRNLEFVLNEVRAAIALGKRTGIFHWPAYSQRNYGQPCAAVHAWIDQGKVESVVFGQRTAADVLIFYHADSFGCFFERVPVLEARDVCWIDPEIVPASSRESAMKNIEASFGLAPAIRRGHLFVDSGASARLP